jgi:VWFA-related protein
MPRGFLQLSRASGRWLVMGAIFTGIGLLGHAQTQSSSPEPIGGQAASQQPIFRSGVTLVTTDVIVRDEDGIFMSDLLPEDFIVEEEGIEQEIASLVRVDGGRVFDVLVETAVPAQEGIILPRVRKVDDTAGRIFVLFIDDLHMTAQLTPKVRQIMETIAENLVHEGDLFGIIATGTSNLSIDLTYDRNMLFAAAEKIVGSGFNPRDMITMQQRRTLSEVRWRAHVAYKTAFETLKNLERINNRRKVFIYISGGYDFNPFGEQYGQDVAQKYINQFEDQPFADVERQGAVFADSELHSEIAELTRAANRSNTTFHTLDPRGLMAGADIEYNLPTQEWNSHVFRTQSSLRSLAELTGGIAIVNRNNFVEGLREIDAETSDYYIVGFNTNRPEAGEARTRQLRIDVRREGAQVRARDSYTFASVATAR